MPKRYYPFEDVFFQQLKTHISPKEVDLGVFKDQNMKTVYDKTLSLLFNGCKKSQSNEKELNIWKKPITQTQTQYRQMLLNGNGQLYLGSSGNSSETNPSSLLEFHCSSCSRTCPKDQKCHFCERFICDTCNQMCSLCQGEFCKLCSVIKYKLQDEVVCLTCST